MRATILIAAVVLAGLVAPSLGAAEAGAARTTCTFPITETDATGTSVTVPEEPERIVTLNPSAAQTMWEIGAREKVVGLSDYASYLEGAADRTDIWATDHVNTEAVVGLEPDLVLAPNTIPDDTVETLRDAGVTVFKFGRSVSIEFIYEKTELIGRLVGECEGAQETVEEMRREVRIIRDAARATEHPRVLYTFFGFTAGRNTFVHEIIETAGARNIAAEVGIEGYRKLSEEVVVNENPRWLLLNSDQPEVPDSDAYQSTYAARHDNVVVLDANYISQPAPRIVQPLSTLTRALHPEAYERAQRRLDEGGGPAFSMTARPLSQTRVELRDEVTVTAEVANAGETGTFVATLILNGTPKAFKHVEIEGGTNETVRLDWEFDATGTFAVALNDERVGTVRVVESLDAGGTATEASPARTPATTADETGQTATPSPTATASPTDSSTPAASGGSGTTDDAEPTDVDRTEEESARTDEARATAAASPTDRSDRGDRATGTTGTTRTTQPGFGIVAATIALAIAILLGLRRA